MGETAKPTDPHWNAFPDCAGLELSVPQGGGPGQTLGLNAELIFGQQSFSGQGVSFRLGVRTGFLRVLLESCAITPGTRFAVRDQTTVERQVRKEETESDKLEADASIVGKLGFGSKGAPAKGEIGGGLAGGKSRERRHSYTQEGTEEMHKVMARGTDSLPSWLIRDPERPTLENRYLGLENLCELDVDGDDYRVTARFTCGRRDLVLVDLERAGWQGPWTATKEKLALAVVANELGKTLEELDEGELTLCRSRLPAGGHGGEGDDG